MDLCMDVSIQDGCEPGDVGPSFADMSTRDGGYWGGLTQRSSFRFDNAEVAFLTDALCLGEFEQRPVYVPIPASTETPFFRADPQETSWTPCEKRARRWQETDLSTSSRLESDSVKRKKCLKPWSNEEETLVLHLVYHFVEHDLKTIAQYAAECDIKRTVRAVGKKVKRLVNIENWQSRNENEMRTRVKDIISQPNQEQLGTRRRALLDNVLQKHKPSLQDSLN